MTMLTVYELTKFLNIKGKTRQETHTQNYVYKEGIKKNIFKYAKDICQTLVQVIPPEVLEIMFITNVHVIRCDSLKRHACEPD